MGLAAVRRSSALHGRAEEAKILGSTLDALTGGGQSVVLIEGEAGIGKSRLLADTLDHARTRGFQVAFGAGEELEQSRPFGVVATALGCSRAAADPRRAAIGDLLAVHGDSGRAPVTVTSDPGLQFRAVDAFVDLVEELALHAPLVIGLDDLQWADPSSLLTINAIVRRLGDLPIALLASYRPLPRAPELQRVVDSLRSAGARPLQLRALPEQAVAAMIAEAVRAEPGPGLLREFASAGGNPLFVLELVSAMLAEGAIEMSLGHADVAGLTLPPTLRLTILRRLSFLPDETLHALRAAAILGSSFTLTELMITSGRTAATLSPLLTEAIVAGVLADDGDRLRFRHDLIRDAIYLDLPGSVRHALHTEAGQRLARAGAPARQVAEQLGRGARPGDRDAIDSMVTAAREEAIRSPAVAADLLERAIALMGPTDADRDVLLVERAGELMWAGRIAEAEAACLAVLNRSHLPAIEAPARTCLGLVLLAAGRQREGLRELELARTCEQLTGEERSVGLGWTSVIKLWLGDLDGVEAAAAQARAAAAAVDDAMTTTIATTMDALVHALRGELSDADRISDAAVALADRSARRAGHRYPVSAPRAFILSDLDRFADAAAALELGTRTSEELGIPWHVTSYQMVRAVERFLSGQWDDAIAEVEANLELAGETGETYSLVVSGGVRALIWLHRNDVSRAQAAADAAIGQLLRTGSRYRAQWAICARALVQEARGDVPGAYATLAASWDACTESGLALERRTLGVDLVRLALANDDPGRATQVCEAVTELAERNDVDSLTGAALHCRGLLHDDPDVLHAAVSAYARGPRVFEWALACEHAAAADIRRGRIDAARPALTQALEVYERLDAARDIARAEAVMRTAGLRRGRRGKRGRPQYGWASLTESEQSVARLVVEGLSNPQIGDRLFVSRKTVQTHLSHVFAKLDVSSRAQLAAEVIRQLGDQPPG